MVEEVKLYHCGFKMTALIVAWLWRKEGRRTTIGRMVDNNMKYIGYFVVGVLRSDD